MCPHWPGRVLHEGPPALLAVTFLRADIRVPSSVSVLLVFQVVKGTWLLPWKMKIHGMNPGLQM